MPCRLEPWEIEFENKRRKEGERQKRVESDLNKANKTIEVLSAKVDNLRELLLMVADGEIEFDHPMVTQVRKDQRKHREDDLKRLAKVFADSGDLKKLKLVANADPDHPLEDQLGFDPDDF